MNLEEFNNKDGIYDEDLLTKFIPTIHEEGIGTDEFSIG